MFTLLLLSSVLIPFGWTNKRELIQLAARTAGPQTGMDFKQLIGAPIQYILTGGDSAGPPPDETGLAYFVRCVEDISDNPIVLIHIDDLKWMSEAAYAAGAKVMAQCFQELKIEQGAIGVTPMQALMILFYLDHPELHLWGGVLPVKFWDETKETIFDDDDLIARQYARDVRDHKCWAEYYYQFPEWNTAVLDYWHRVEIRQAKRDLYRAEQQALQPIYQEPIYQEPIYQEPIYQEPIYQEPSYQEPSYQEPSYQEPVYGQITTRKISPGFNPTAYSLVSRLHELFPGQHLSINPTQIQLKKWFSDAGFTYTNRAAQSMTDRNLREIGRVQGFL